MIGRRPAARAPAPRVVRATAVVALAAVGALGLASGPGGDLAAELAGEVNRRRATRGDEPMSVSDALGSAAQAKANALAAESATFPSLRPEQVVAHASLEDLPELLARAGFEPQRATAHVIVADLPIGNGDLLDREPALTADLLDPDLREFGIGVVRQGALEFVVAVVGRSKQIDFELSTRGLRDLAAVREELLRLTNEARRENARPPLRRDRCLEKAAQAYAERMLSEGFYGHFSPEGYDVTFRVRAAGCRSRNLAENLARGQTGPDLVIDGWLDSPGHRENLLNPRFRRVGFGLALGRRPGEYWIVWVQVLGSD